nr:PIN domain-containing protein [Romeria gracilis]
MTFLVWKVFVLENVVLFDRDAALTVATIRAQLERQGTPIGTIDVLIARVALSLQATLVTHNVAEFSRVSELAIADWC